jgi:hypothetical protein
VSHDTEQARLAAVRADVAQGVERAFANSDADSRDVWRLTLSTDPLVDVVIEPAHPRTWSARLVDVGDHSITIATGATLDDCKRAAIKWLARSQIRLFREHV